MFGGLLEIFGARASDADLAERWDEIVGSDLARLGRLAGVRGARTQEDAPKGGAAAVSAKRKRFNISIRPAIPAMATELSYRAEEFRARINKYFGYEAVGKITMIK